MQRPLYLRLESARGRSRRRDCALLSCCIASDIDANTEALAGKGMTFPVGNTVALQQCLQQALEASAQVQQIGQTLYQHVLSHYTWTLVTEQFMRFYQKALPFESNPSIPIMTMQANPESTVNLPSKVLPDAHTVPAVMLAEPQVGYGYPLSPKIPLAALLEYTAPLSARYLAQCGGAGSINLRVGVLD